MGVRLAGASKGRAAGDFRAGKLRTLSKAPLMDLMSCLKRAASSCSAASPSALPRLSLAAGPAVGDDRP